MLLGVGVLTKKNKMARANIKVTEIFTNKTVEIALRVQKNGTQSQRISDELANFVQNRLQEYNLALYRQIKLQRFEYNQNKVFISWKGGGARTIKRLIHEKKCSEALFHVIGYYLFGPEWDSAKQQSFIDVSRESEDIEYVIYFDNIIKKDWVITFGVLRGLGVKVSTSLKFDVYEKEGSNKLIGRAEVNLIGFENSLFVYHPIGVGAKYNLNKGKKYRALLQRISSKLLLLGFEGSEVDRSLLEDVLSNRAVPRIQLTDKTETLLFIKWNQFQEKYFLWQRNRAIFITSIPWTRMHLDILFSKYLSHIYYWKYLIELDNPSKSIPVNDVEIIFSSNQVHQVINDDLISLTSPLSWDYNNEKIPYNVIATNRSNTTYFCSCLIATENYGVFVSTQNLLLEANKALELIHYQHAAFEISNQEESVVVNYIKVIISEERIDTIATVEQDELPLNNDLEISPTRGVTSREVVDVKENWITKTIAVKITREV
jgi:hypothetical protein